MGKTVTPCPISAAPSPSPFPLPLFPSPFPPPPRPSPSPSPVPPAPLPLPLPLPALRPWEASSRELPGRLVLDSTAPPSELLEICELSQEKMSCVFEDINVYMYMMYQAMGVCLYMQDWEGAPKCTGRKSSSPTGDCTGSSHQRSSE